MRRGILDLDAGGGGHLTSVRHPRSSRALGQGTDLREEFTAKFSSRILVKGLRRNLAKLLDGGFEAGKKSLAGLATIQVLLQICAERIIELFVEVVGELGEEGFAGGGAFLGCCRGRLRPESRFLWSSGAEILPGQFLANKEACTMETHANISGAKACDVSHFFVRETFHIPQHENDTVLRREFLNHFAQASGLLTADGQRFRVNGTFLGEMGEFVTIGHESVERKTLLGSELALPAGH